MLSVKKPMTTRIWQTCRTLWGSRQRTHRWIGAGLLACAPLVQMQTTTSAHAVLTAPHKATLSTQITGRIQRLYVKKGESFKKGDRLVDMDCTRYKMAAKQAAAALKEARLIHTAHKKLAKLNAIDTVAWANTQSKYEHAIAETRIHEAQVAACRIMAPFSGTVVKTYVYTHENVRLHQPLIEIIDDQSLDIEMFIPSEWITWVKVGTPFTIKLSETQHRYPAHITHLIPQVDAVSQSLPVKGKFDKMDRTLMAGMSGEAYFKKPTHNTTRAQHTAHSTDSTVHATAAKGT